MGIGGALHAEGGASLSLRDGCPRQEIVAAVEGAITEDDRDAGLLADQFAEQRA